MKAAEYARAAHASLAHAKTALRLGVNASAKRYIARAREWWALFLAAEKTLSVAARRTAALAEGSPRWRPTIHVPCDDCAYTVTLCFSLKTYAHRQSADRAAKKATATLFA